MSKLSDNLNAYIVALNAGDFEGMCRVLDLAQFDLDLNNAIVNWHAEHDELIPLTKEQRFKIWQIVNHQET